MVLQEHDWNVEDALQVLQMFSYPGVNTTAAIYSIFALVLGMGNFSNFNI